MLVSGVSPLPCNLTLNASAQVRRQTKSRLHYSPDHAILQTARLSGLRDFPDCGTPGCDALPLMDFPARIFSGLPLEGEEESTLERRKGLELLAVHDTHCSCARSAQHCGTGTVATLQQLHCNKCTTVATWKQHITSDVLSLSLIVSQRSSCTMSNHTQMSGSIHEGNDGTHHVYNHTQMSRSIHQGSENHNAGNHCL